jgi:hypothetical protein
MLCGTVFTVGDLPEKRVVDAGLIVRVVDDRIIIERDVNDKPLSDALLQAGVPREQIIMAYVGEPIEEFAA